MNDVIMNDVTMIRVRQISEQVKVSYDDMKITSEQIEKLMDKHREQHKRFLECCTKLKEILNNEDSI